MNATGQPSVKESFRSRWLRRGFNFFPVFRRMGGRVTYIAPDMREVRLKVPLNWQTKNYVGTIYGGSMFGAVDPIYMLMLIRILGKEYIVWDKSASIRFLKPGRTTLYATFLLDEAELEEIRRLVADQGKTERLYTVELVDSQGVPHASVEKTIHIRGR